MNISSVTEKCGGNYGFIALVSGIAAAVLGVLPLLISYFVALHPFVWVFGAISIIAAALSFSKKESGQRPRLLIGVVCSVFGLLVPTIFVKQYYVAKGEYAIALVDDIVSATNTDQMLDVASELTDDALPVGMKAVTKYAKDSRKIEDRFDGMSRSMYRSFY